MFQQGTQAFCLRHRKVKTSPRQCQAPLAWLCLPILTSRVVLMVGDELGDGVEQVLFCQVILVLGRAAYHVVADGALRVSADTLQGISTVGRMGRG